MNINWVLADATDLDPTTDLDRIKSIGSLWGSWRTWRACQTDNVVCHNAVRAQQLLAKGFAKNCNFYISNTVYVALDEPEPARTYGGDFSHEIDNQDELVAMHLAASVSDIVLLLGFDWSQQPTPTDPDMRLRRHNYVNLVRQALIGNSDTQWVLIDHGAEIMPELASVANLTKDTLENVFGTLTN